MIVGIVLAAGRSTRFGVDNKLLALFRGKPLVAHVAEAMRGVSLSRRVAVVQDDAMLPVFEGFDIIRPPSGSGQARSVIAGVSHAIGLRAERILIALGDMPFVDADILQAVLDKCDGDHGSAMSGRLPPAAFPAARFDELLALTGDRGAGGLLRDLPDRLLVPAPPFHALDIDTLADLERLNAQPF